MVVKTVEALKREQIGNICLFADKEGEQASASLWVSQFCTSVGVSSLLLSSTLSEVFHLVCHSCWVLRAAGVQMRS
jgi:hypothetical protein